MRRLIVGAAIWAGLTGSAQAHGNVSQVTQAGPQTCISSNDTPNHEMGVFPNRANPNAFRAQHLTFCFSTHPQMAEEVTEGLMTVGVTLTGLPIRPYTAGYYDPEGRRGLSQKPESGWRQQAMFAPRSLGMDAENAHVDRSGLYHYHAVSPSYFASVEGSHIGYAPDGFELHYAGDAVTSSWRLKTGSRPAPVGGTYDGAFEQDFEFVDGAGDLDACNGRMEDGTYRYYATDSYPYFPRCFVGVIDGTFMRRQ